MVFMPVMQIRIMRVGVAQRLMAMPMGMRLAHLAFMVMLVMLVVDMAVFMLKHAVLVFMHMALGQMKPQPDGHQYAGDHQLPCHALMQQPDGDKCADERGK